MRELAEIIGADVRGEGDPLIESIVGTKDAGPNQITWIAEDKYLEQLDGSQAAAIIVPKPFGPTSMPALLVGHIDVAVGKAMNALAPIPPSPEMGVHSTAIISDRAKLGDQVCIGPQVIIAAGANVGNGCKIHSGAYVGENTFIGEGCTLWQNVVVREGCTVGKRVIIHANAVIGADGFGYFFQEKKHNKIHHAGGVCIGDDAEIGACACIDRAKFGHTTVGPGTKIDNLVQVGHNVQIGAHCLIVGHVGIAGSAKLDNYVVVGGNAGIKDHVVLHDGVRVAAMSGVTKDIPSGTTVCGFPAIERTQFMREQANVRRMPKLFEQIRNLEKRVAELEQK